MESLITKLGNNTGGCCMLGKRIRECRERLGLTQGQLGERIHASASTVNRYEKGVHRPTPDALKELAEIFGVSADYLLGSTDIPAPDTLKDPDIDAWLRSTKGLSDADRQELLRFADWLRSRPKGVTRKKSD